VETEKVIFNSLSIYGSTNLAIHEQGGAGGNVYHNLKLIRRPGSNRLMVSNADGFHSSCTGTG